MKTLKQYLTERLNIKKTSYNYNYFPDTKEELQEIIKQRINKEGYEVDLNDIDTSNITDMSYLFFNSNFNGDISTWDVSKVTNMHRMFMYCKEFNQDISNWDVSNVKDMMSMFYNCKEFNKDISDWNVSNVKNPMHIFDYCQIEDKYKPSFK